MSRDSVHIPTLRAVRDAAIRALEDSTIKWTPFEKFVAQLNEAITTAERDNGS